MLRFRFQLSLLALMVFLLTGCFSDDDQFRPSPEDTFQQSRDLVTDWTATLLEAERYAQGLRPNASARALAYIYLAAYETSLPFLEEYASCTTLFPDLRIVSGQNLDLDLEFALHSSFTVVVRHFIANLPPDQREALDQFIVDNDNRIIQGLDQTKIVVSRSWGQYVARQVIEYSQTDAEAEAQILEPQPLSYEPPVAPGYWTYSADPERALFPYWERVRTFVVPVEATTTVPPMEYSLEVGSPYRNEMEEVYTANNAALAENGEQLWIAEFWSDDVVGLMMSPPARQIAIAIQLVEQYDLELGEALYLLLKTGFALNDAAVACWKYKYQHMVMRPSVYIQTNIDPNYQTNLFRFIDWPNPTFPSYPSGHSTFASAAAGVFIDAFGNQTNFTDRTHEGRTEFRGEPRTFSSFEQLADENAFSRIPLGVHIRIDCTEGLRLGYEIADGVNQLELR
ncbi:MAG: vanadium-dependent haloperoxidase [Bacteroidota bacterium]